MLAATMTMADNRNDQNRRAQELYFGQLLQRVANQRDKASFGTLFDHFAPRIKSFMLRKGVASQQAEDLVQETMIAVWTKAGLFDAERGSVTTWIFTIARNLRIDRIRRESSMPLTELGDYDEADDEPGSDAVLSRKQEDTQVGMALKSIPADQREILMLAYVDDFSQSEIAQRLNMPLGTVKSRMRLAYGHMRKMLETTR